MAPTVDRPPAPAVTRPTAAELRAAAGVTIPDLIAANLLVLFSGINPSLYSGATGLHFARPGNRFWPALWASGFTPRLLSPTEGRVLLALGLGITNLVARATAGAADLRDDELRAGARTLASKVRRYRPRVLAVVGITAYRIGFNRPAAALGQQPDDIAGVPIWVVPNTSGLNAHHQAADFARAFTALRQFAETR